MNHFPLDLCPKYEEKFCSCIMHFTKEHMHAFKSFTFHLCFLLFWTHIMVSDSVFGKLRLKAKFKLWCPVSWTASSASLFHDFISSLAHAFFLSLQWNVFKTLWIWLTKEKIKLHCSWFVLQKKSIHPYGSSSWEDAQLGDILGQGSERLLTGDH